MFHSAEIRWFFEGPAPQTIDRWFDESSLAITELPRTDHYLYLPRCSTVGVKIREGLFEVKAQTTAPEVVEYPNGLRGNRGNWVKWSHPAGIENHEYASEGEIWVPVTKQRRIRLFEVTGDTATEVPPSSNIDGSGCQVELAQLETSIPVETSWWSFCLEAFGPPDEVSGTLAVSASQNMYRDVAEMLTPESSMSYPLWLTKFMDPRTVE